MKQKYVFVLIPVYCLLPFLSRAQTAPADSAFGRQVAALLVQSYKKQTAENLAAEIEATQGAGKVGIDLEAQTITTPEGKTLRFDIDPRRREGLLQGLDEVMLTLQRDHEIRAFQEADRTARPWIHFARKSA